jgi:hypothetical protein
MDPPFFDFSPEKTVYDGFYPADNWATFGVLVSTAHYLFDADLWGMLLRGRQPTTRQIESSPSRVAAPEVGRRPVPQRRAVRPDAAGVASR